MDSGDGKEKGGITAARKGEEMKSLEKATADYEKAKEKMEASKARYEYTAPEDIENGCNVLLNTVLKLDEK